VQCVMKNGILWSVKDVAEPFAQIDAGASVCPAH